MSAFGGLILTNRGRILQAKAQTGIALKYTRIALGDGPLGNSQIIELNALKHEVISLPIGKLKVNNGNAIVGTVLNNNDLSSGFYFREIGVFASDPDFGEILYCYGNAGNLAEYIPAGGGADVVEKAIDIQVLTGNAPNVTAVIEQSLIFETPEGAQQKVDASLSAAKSYTDQEIANIDLSAFASKQEVAAHLAEDAIHLAGGTANAITINTGGNYSYDQFKQLRFKATANNTGNVTINVDGEGVVPALKFDGAQLPAGAIKKDKIYDFYYDTASGGRFFLIAKASGDAGAGDVLAGKIASNDDGEFVGAMPNRGSVGTQQLTTQNQIYTIPTGYHNGSGRVQANISNLSAGNIRKGVSVGGVAGTVESKDDFIRKATINVPSNAYIFIPHPWGEPETLLVHWERADTKQSWDRSANVGWRTNFKDAYGSRWGAAMSGLDVAIAQNNIELNSNYAGSPHTYIIVRRQP